VNSSFFKYRLGVACIALLLTGDAFAASNPQATPQTTLAPNQTAGFGDREVLTLTYQQNFACVTEPRDDRDHNNIKAESDALETEVPICQIGATSNITPTGAPIRKARPLYTIAPFFSLSGTQNPNDAFSPDLGNTLIGLFGIVPEAFKKKPLVPVQCPTPGGLPGTCTMHAPTVDVFPTLAAQGKIPPSPAFNIFIPSPNHDHIIDDDVTNAIPRWWQIISVSIFDPADWPSLDGRTGIVSVEQLKAAEAAGRAVETPTNVFLFFSSKELHQDHHRGYSHDDDDRDER